MGDIDRITPPPPAIRIADHPHGLFVLQSGREGRNPKPHQENPGDVVELHEELPGEPETVAESPIDGDAQPHLDISA